MKKTLARKKAKGRGGSSILEKERGKLEMLLHVKKFGGMGTVGRVGGYGFSRKIEMPESDGVSLAARIWKMGMGLKAKNPLSSSARKARQGGWLKKGLIAWKPPRVVGREVQKGVGMGGWFGLRT